MMNYQYLVIFCMIINSVFILKYIVYHSPSVDISTQLLEIIRIQNETIIYLETIMKNNVDSSTNHSISQIHKISSLKSSSIMTLETVKPSIPIISDTIIPIANRLAVPKTGFEEECNRRYGLELIDLWKSSKETWCSSQDDNTLDSHLECYPYHQEHKKKDGRGPDMFCIAKNFFIDFSKVFSTLTSFYFTLEDD